MAFRIPNLNDEDRFFPEETGKMLNPKNTILCVENDADTCELITYVLQEKGFQVIHCTSPEEAIRYARSDSYAAMITDYYFREIDGTDLCRAVRIFDQTIPVIFFTAEARANNRQAAIDAGAQAYITIPADFEKFAQTVIQLIDKRKLG